MSWANGDVKYVKVEGCDWNFNTEGDIEPVGPLRLKGEFMTVGWDIATHYAIDANMVAWMCGGHGATLSRVLVSELLANLDGDAPHIATEVRNLYGIPLPPPAWHALALAAGWTPPAKGT